MGGMLSSAFAKSNLPLREPFSLKRSFDEHRPRQVRAFQRGVTKFRSLQVSVRQVPAYAGMTWRWDGMGTGRDAPVAALSRRLDSRLRGNDGHLG